LASGVDHCPRGIRFTNALLLIAIFVSSQPGGGAFGAGPDPIAGQRKTVTCNGCHAQAGMKNVPNLGAQNAPYLFAAMQAYQDGVRAHATMRDVAKSFSTQELKNLAAYYAQAPAILDEPAAADPPAVTVVCASCHGPTGAVSLRADIPKLAGQKAAYLELALKDYRSGVRRHTVMQQQAEALSDTDIATLAGYYAGREGLLVK
jgi:cytochrome c553